jgi:hypothetical protein
MSSHKCSSLLALAGSVWAILSSEHLLRKYLPLVVWIFAVFVLVVRGPCTSGFTPATWVVKDRTRGKKAHGLHLTFRAQWKA